MPGNLNKIFLVAILFSCTQSIFAYKKHSLSLISENDAYYTPLNYDRYYSSGHGLTYTSRDFDNTWLTYLGLSRLIGTPSISRFSFGIYQEIHHADDKATFIPRPDDALYGGYLYGNIGVHNGRQNFFESLSLNFGVVGKYAFAKEVQNGVHELLHVRPQNGWDTQIHTEPIFNLYYNAIFRIPILKNYIELLPFGEIALGNAHTHLACGMHIRAGYGLVNDFGITHMRAGNKASTNIDNGFRFYVIAGLNQRIIGRNIFIEGNTIGGVQSNLVLNHFVHEFSLGATIGYAGWNLSYIFIQRQKEFETQKAPFSYGTVRLEIAF